MNALNAMAKKHYEIVTRDADKNQLANINAYWALVDQAIQSDKVKDHAMIKRVASAGYVQVIIWENDAPEPEYYMDDVVLVEVVTFKRLTTMHNGKYDRKVEASITCVRAHLYEWLVAQQVHADSQREQTTYRIIETIHENGLARNVFMEMFRTSDQLKEQMTADDCVEVFTNVLLGEEDLSVGLFDDVCEEYGTSLAELAEKDGHHFH